MLTNTDGSTLSPNVKLSNGLKSFSHALKFGVLRRKTPLGRLNKAAASGELFRQLPKSATHLIARTGPSAAIATARVR